MAAMRMMRRRLAGAAAATAAALAIGVAPAHPAAASEPPPGQIEIENAGAAGAIPGSYIVTLDEKAAPAGSAAGKALARSLGAQVKHTYETALNGYAVRMSRQQAEKFAEHPAVKSVVQDAKVSLTSTQVNPPSWSLDRIDQRSSWLDNRYSYPDSAGRGVTAYIIDTGVHISHKDFAGRASYGFDAIDGKLPADDGVGHGTHVAATVAGTSYGVAKKAKVVSVRVLDDSGLGTISSVVAGVDWVTANAVKPAVANLSLGGGVSSAIDTAVRRSIDSGVTYTVAAGNQGQDATNSSPARVEEAITVGATDRRDTRPNWANYGSAVDLFAPGVDITSAWTGSDTATETVSGTSMAAPHVAGAAALYLSGHPWATPRQVSSALTWASTFNAVNNAGPGSPNQLLKVP